MCCHVFLDIRLLREGTAADDALKRPLACVDPHVLLEVKVLRELFQAVRTLELSTKTLLAIVSLIWGGGGI